MDQPRTFQTFQQQFAEGYKARSEGRAAESRAIFLDAVRKAAEAREETSLAEALCGLAQAERDIGNLEAARHHYASAGLLYRRMNFPARTAHALRHEADVLTETGQPTEAEPLYREAEQIFREAGAQATLDLANTLRGLALVHEAAGTSAQDLWSEARTLYAQRNVEAGVAECDRKLAKRRTD